tara:strand:- start:2451 stop:2735 length:285 start_codon:yes stop_codon:yes gene_type:complete
MAVTALEVNTGITIVKSKVVSTETEAGLFIQLYRCDDSWKEMGAPREFGEPNKSEEQYHTELRKNASESNHFRQAHSTDPEWSPEVKPKKEEDV